MTVSPPVRRAFEIGADPTFAIRLDGVSKAYKVYERPIHLLKEAILGRPYHRDKHVLSDISLTVSHGEIVGIIGINGAGKSTLLKIIAGTLAATEGTVEVNGRVSAILELGTGFNPNYSGRDNVILSGLMRGMPEQAIRAKFDSIVAFAGLAHVIDEPFHTYSSGMQARLAFAAAVSVEADVLIVDEALAAGDARFAARSMRRIHEICASGVTALFVSHQTYHVMQLCTRAVWIDSGRIRMDGEPVEVVRAYEYEVHEAIARDHGRMMTPASGVEDATTAVADAEPDVAAPAAELVGASTTDAADVDVLDVHTPSPMTQTAPVEAIESCAETAGERDATPAFVQPRPQESVEVPAPSGGTIATASGPYLPELREGLGDAPALTDTAHRFSTGEYRIADIGFMDKAGRRTNIFRFGDVFRLRVAYECLLPKLPTYSCGLAVAFNRVSDFEAVMYFNTNYAHSDAEVAGYFDKPFRKFIGRQGVIEATIDPIQLRAGEYYVSLGILPNQPGMHEFYEYIHCRYRVQILANGFDEPSVFYPMVAWTNGPRA